MAGLLGFDQQAMLDERDPAKQDIDIALTGAAARIRKQWTKELAQQIAVATWGEK